MQDIVEDITEETNCYTYKVEMIIQILAKDLLAAEEKLEAIGGHVSSRKVELLKTTKIAVFK